MCSPPLWKRSHRRRLSKSLPHRRPNLPLLPGQALTPSPFRRKRHCTRCSPRCLKRARQRMTLHLTRTAQAITAMPPRKLHARRRRNPIGRRKPDAQRHVHRRAGHQLHLHIRHLVLHHQRRRPDRLFPQPQPGADYLRAWLRLGGCGRKGRGASPLLPHCNGNRSGCRCLSSARRSGSGRGGARSGAD